ncbi:MAG: fibronectin type III domain-containing protein [Treponema sp.]|nr:fibronectin type III domain-containing protein [Treponema sp.]
MKKRNFFEVVLLAVTVLFLVGCPDPDPIQEETEPYSNPSEQNTYGASNSYFWGTWIRMDNGKEYKFSEKNVVSDGMTYTITSTSDTSITVNTLGKFEKQSDSVLVSSSVPYFRKGGSNLDYTLKIVGFSDGASRAAISSRGKGGVRVTGTSETYSTYHCEATSDAEGEVKLKAPVAGDTQTIVVDNGNDKFRVTGLQVNHSNEKLGTIPIVEPGDYAFKISGTISEYAKHEGYLYSGKTYPMTLKIENISNVKSNVAFTKIESANTDYVGVTTTDPIVTNLSGFPLQTLNPGTSTTIALLLDCRSFSSPYVDTELKITIEGSGGKTWVDSVPLRIFRGRMPVTIAAKSISGNSSAKLNGFLIYPDGNNKFFSIADGSSGIVYVPTFKASESYMLVFSGASSTSKTEMFYTVNVDSKDKINVETTGEATRPYYQFAEPNQTEDSAFTITTNTSFEALLEEDDIDFYRISIESDSTEYCGAKSYYSLSSSSVTSSSVSLSWSLLSGEAESTVYLYRGTTSLGSFSSSTTTYTATGLSAQTEYSFILKDASGNTLSSTLNVKTSDPPPLVLSCTSKTSNSVTLKFTNDKGKSGTAYLFKDGYYYSDKTFSSTDSEGTFTVTGLSSSTSYTFVLKDSRYSGNELSNSISVTTSYAVRMTGSPTAHGSVNYYTSDYTISDVDLNWTSVTGAAKYRVYRYVTSSSSTTVSSIKTYGTLVATTSNLYYTDTTVSGTSLYRYVHYTIVPVDSSGNIGTASTPIYFHYN